MSTTLPDFSSSQVLVAGDVMLDRYWYGDTARISPEAPVPVVRVGETESRPGGAANVAMNLAALGVKTDLFGLVGDDDAGRVLADQLKAAGVGVEFYLSGEGRTTSKLRIVSRHQQLIRLDFEATAIVAALTADEVFVERLRASRVLVISDYAKGAVAEPSALISAAREADVPVVVDPKGADFQRYRGATLLTPNLAEFESIVGHCTNEAEVSQRGRCLMQNCELEALLVTRGEAGMTLLEGNEEPVQIPACAREVFDVTGAGDTVVAVVAGAMATGVELKDAVSLANLAASLVVSKLGTANVSTKELEQALASERMSFGGVVDERELTRLLAQAGTRRQKIVMTNGCFDLLHAGHVNYLQEARSFGDRLVVAVNDDLSVKRLKGEDRPVNTLHTRMAMLTALKCVDWVVSFSEDTPEGIIELVSPDVLVKGGDNDPERIPGAEYVKSRGGEVRVCGFVAGFSTTGLISGIRGDR